MTIETILHKTELTKDDIIQLLQTKGNDEKLLLNYAGEVKQQFAGNTVYLRGLIEFSNICTKDCYYCGIRKSNVHIQRYILSEKEVLDAVQLAYKWNFGSVVIQSGEVQHKTFTEKIDRILKASKELTNGKIGITLSCGEQSEDTYCRWFDSGAHRYLLRVESSSRELYRKIHPRDKNHSFVKRLEALNTLKRVGYQTGTGVMIGLPFQTIENLADDLLFMKQFDIDMCGMGPYIGHHETPLFAFKDSLMPLKERFNLSLKMIAILRIMMKDINIASTTALQTIDKNGREKGFLAGANVMMPNITPLKYREEYVLYKNKPASNESEEDTLHYIEEQLKKINHQVGYNDWGDSKHFNKKQKHPINTQSDFFRLI
ncbi:MAG: [FeFe] hydrogenase H-cluster radical SAM maturase HydE [Paludibacteraceae bacterium]